MKCDVLVNRADLDSSNDEPLKRSDLAMLQVLSDIQGSAQGQENQLRAMQRKHTSLRCRIWVADNPLGDFYIKITF